MADIALSQGVRQNLLSMQKTVELMSRTQNRLATGKKVNTALDNPTSYFVAAGLDNRSNDLSRLLDSMGLGIKTLEAADNGIRAIKKLIETAQGTARQALQAASSAPTVTSTRTDLTAATDITLAANGGFAAGDTITVAVAGGAAVTAFTAAAGSTLQDVVDAINTNTTLNPAGAAPTVMASIENGRLVVESLTGDAITVGSSAAAKLNLARRADDDPRATAYRSTRSASPSRCSSRI